MMMNFKRTAVLTLPAAALLALGASPAALSAGGLSITPSIIEHAAKAGSVGTVVVDNSSNTALKVTVTPRPWKQARSGAVAPNKKRTLLGQVGVSARSFTLAPNSRKSVAVSLKRTPSGGALYGALDVVGLPTKAARKKASGVVTGYRLIGSLRLTPGSKRYRVAVGRAGVSGKALVLAVKSTGNTIDPIAGTVKITGARGGKTTTLTATKVLPGSTVDFVLGSAAALPKGSYRAKVVLTQGGRTVASTTRGLKVG
jgi:hypothetical protein